VSVKVPTPRCLLCGHRLRSTIEEPAGEDKPDVLVCGQHSDQDLRDQGLDDLWGGVEPQQSPAFFEGGTARVVGVWEQGEGVYGVYILLDDGDLILLSSWGCCSGVSTARVHRSRRLLERPVGVPRCERAPWQQAAAEGWPCASLKLLPDESVALKLAGHGTVLFTTYPATWREMGEFRHFLQEQWIPSEE
jgi:hypothetical protein